MTSGLSLGRQAAACWIDGACPRTGCLLAASFRPAAGRFCQRSSEHLHPSTVPIFSLQRSVLVARFRPYICDARQSRSLTSYRESFTARQLQLHPVSYRPASAPPRHRMGRILASGSKRISRWRPGARLSRIVDSSKPTLIQAPARCPTLD